MAFVTLFSSMTEKNGLIIDTKKSEKVLKAEILTFSWKVKTKTL